MNKFSVLLSLSFFIASVADLQAYRGQEVINKGLEKGKELFAFVQSSKKAQIGLGVTAAGILVLTVVALKRKSSQVEQNAAAKKDESDGFKPALTRDQKRKAKRKVKRAAKQEANRKETY